MRTTLSGLYGITDSVLMPTLDQMLIQVELSILGGARLIQYRDKSSDSVKRQNEASALNNLCQSYNVALIINDDIELALSTGAAGVHLGQSDGELKEARDKLGNDAIIGITCHDSLTLAEKAEQQGADYVAFGAFFQSKTKPHAKPAPFEANPLSQRKT